MNSMTPTAASSFLCAFRFAVSSTKDRAVAGSVENRELVKSLGDRFGREYAKTVSVSGESGLVAHLSSFADAAGIGRFRLKEARLLEVSGCYDCVFPRKASRGPTCVFEEGFLQGVYGGALGVKAEVHEITCCSSSGTSCVFAVKLSAGPKELGRNLILDK